MKFDWKQLVGTVAPTLATALGSPLAGMATKAMCAAVLGDEHASEDDLATALQSASPETLRTLKQADNDFRQHMADLGVDLEEIAAQDRDSARRLQGNTKSWAVPVLGSLTVAGFFTTVGWVLTGQVSLESTLLGFVLGQVSAKAEQVYNFYFGSSAGSKEKTAYLTQKP
jgi:hypothetical protein